MASYISKYFVGLVQFRTIYRYVINNDNHAVFNPGTAGLETAVPASSNSVGTGWRRGHYHFYGPARIN